MHLIESYATNCGVQIDKPYIREKYFPLPFERYITLHTTSKDAKTYDFFNDVTDILFPILEEAGVKIVQIGGKEDKPARNSFNLLGRTNVNQTAYVVTRGLLHLGVDSFPVHLASGNPNHKIVALYSTNFKEVVKPYWGDPKNHILLEPNRNGDKPTFANQENPKTINTIKPEEIARSVCQLLNLPFKWRFETIYTGSVYHHPLVEAVPNQIVDINSLGIDALIVRMDYAFNEQALFQQTELCSCSIVTNKAINLDLLKQRKNKIIEVVYVIEEENQPIFVRDLQRLGIKYHLLTYLPNEQMEKYKLNFMEFGLLHRREIKRPEVLDKYQKNKIFYKSSKFILSDKKCYPSRTALLQNRPIPGIGPVICHMDIPPVYEHEFLKEVENFVLMVDTQ